MVLLYRSADLRSWEYLHPLAEGAWTGVPGSNPVDTGEMWECPDFFALTDLASGAQKHILIHSAEGKVLWQSGVLDRPTMRFASEKTGELDYGRVGTSRVTFYAPKTQLDARGNRILWGWIGETRPDAECVQAGWSGLMSLPRALTLRDGELQMEPAAQVGRLRVASFSQASREPKQVHEFTALLKQTEAEASPYELADATGTLLSVRSDPAQEPRTLRVSFGNGVPAIVVPLPAALPGEVSLHAFCDNSVLKIFVDKRFCITHRFYSRSPGSAIATVSVAGRYLVTEPRGYRLKRIWPG